MATSGYLNDTSYNSILTYGVFSAAATGNVPQQPSIYWLPDPMETSPGQVNLYISNAEPGETLTVTLDGTTIATVVADSSGQWSGFVPIPSTTANPVVRSNLAIRPECDTWGSGSDLGAFNAMSGGTYVLQPSGGPGSVPTYARKTSTTAQGTNAFGSVIQLTADSPDASSNPPPGFNVQADTTYTLSAYLRYTPAASGGALTGHRLTYQFYDQSGASQSAETSATFAATGTGWTQASWTFTAPHGGSLLAAYVFPVSAQYNPNDTYDISSIMLEAATGLGTYFDGNLGAPGGYSVYWTGMPLDSTSQMRATHTLQVVGTQSPAATGLMRINSGPLSITTITSAGSPPASGTKWLFSDDRAGANPTSYLFPHNPSSWRPPVQVPILSTAPTTAPGGNILTWEGGAEPAPFEFAGTIQSQTDYQNLDYWVNLKRRFWLVDHRGVSRLITLTEFDAVPRVRGGWVMDYTIRGLQFSATGALA